MAFKLPYSRVVNVTLTRNSNFPTRRGFGVPLFLTQEEVAGVLDSSNYTFVASSTEEISAAGFSTAGDFYKASAQAFAQQPRPVQVKAGYYDDTVAVDSATMQAALDTLYNADNQWYWLCIEAALRDQLAELDGIVTWTEAKPKFALIDTNDSATESAADTANFSYVHKGTVERTGTFYDQDATQFGGFALAALLGTFNFDDADSAYTAKFKKLRGLSPIDIDSNGVQAITGFTPNLGQSTTAGHCANTYIDIGGINFVVEGSTLTPNVFIDEIHASDWIIARTEEEMLAILANNKRVPMDRRGMEQLASGPRKIMSLANRAGLIANDFDVALGEISPSVQIVVPDVLDVPAAQRAARIAPAITVNFRYAGAVHYTTVNYYMNF